MLEKLYVILENKRLTLENITHSVFFIKKSYISQIDFKNILTEMSLIGCSWTTTSEFLKEREI
jgi:hypothetical protein